MWTESTIKTSYKATENDLSPYLTELEGHKIGYQYKLSPPAARYTLVLIDKQGHCVLVSGGGIGVTSSVERLHNYSRVPYDDEVLLEGQEPEQYYFDWLTWRANDSKKTYKHGPLSNFWIERDGKSLEHRFATAKTNDLRRKAAIFSAKTPGQAKRMGQYRQKTKLRPDWDEIKRDLMWDLLLKKFMSDKFCREYLLATENMIIREKNDWNDTIWGVNKKNHGQNLLGHGLMYVRDVLNGS